MATSIIIYPDQLYSYFSMSSPTISPTSVSASVDMLAGFYFLHDVTITGTSDEYFVNINSLYDINIGPNLGTSANPFNYDEFVDRINVSGTGKLWDVYNIQGYRELLPVPINTENWEIRTDPTKKFVIQAWDLSAYGPWMMILYGNTLSADYNPKLSFAGTIIKNGIVYNAPYYGVGSEIEVSMTYDMLINSLGEDSALKLTPTAGIYYSISGTTLFSNSCYLVGSTIYTENGITDNSPPDYTVNAVDSVCRNFMIISDDENYGHFSGCTLNIYNSTFDIMPEMGTINNYDNFSAGIINAYWNSAFSANYNAAHYPSSATSYAVSASLSAYGISEQINPISFDGDFSIKFGIITTPTSYSPSGCSIGIEFSYENGEDDFLGLDLLYDPSLDSQVRYESINGAFSVTQAFTFSAYQEIQFKMIRQQSSISAYADTGSGWQFLASITDNSDVQGTLTIYAVSNNDFGFSYLDCKSAAFIEGVFVEVQDEWTPPEPYPFTQSHFNYKQNLDYVIDNKPDLAPFDDIKTPPNPGFNFPVYQLYETGLFGYSRRYYIKPVG